MRSLRPSLWGLRAFLRGLIQLIFMKLEEKLKYK